MGESRKYCTRYMALATKLRIVFMISMMSANAEDTNGVFSPCMDATIQKSDGFTFGLAFAARDAFFRDMVQLSPCDNRLGLAGSNAQLAVFRPKVDEISLLTINRSQFDPAMAGGYMVAFAGSKYAARSPPVMLVDNAHIITSFTLVLEFQKGILHNLYWKSFGCDSCSGQANVCLNNQDCAVPFQNCNQPGACDINIQLTFSGTDKNDDVLNSWYEVRNLRRFSLYGLYSDVRNGITNPF